VAASQRLGRILAAADELAPARKASRLAALGDEGLVDRPSVDDDVRHGALSTRRWCRAAAAGDSAAATCGERTRSMRADRSTISFAPSRRRRFMARGEHRMAVGRVGADHDITSACDRVEVLRAGRLAERLLEAVAGRRMADARAGVDVVVAEGGAHQLLHQVGLPRWCSARR
jgi:hypothetical protein